MRQNLLNVSIGSKALLWSLIEAAVDEVLARLRHLDTVLLGIREEDWFTLDQIIHFLII